MTLLIIEQSIPWYKLISSQMILFYRHHVSVLGLKYQTKRRQRPIQTSFDGSLLTQGIFIALFSYICEMSIKISFAGFTKNTIFL